MKTRIKICGVGDAGTLAVAVAAGADAVGLVFHPPSHRHLSLAAAAAVASAAPPLVATVAVMVNPDADEVAAIIEHVAPTLLQFHGEEPAAFCASFGLPYIKTLRVAADKNLSAALKKHARDYATAAGVLLDTHADDRYGGTGEVFDWSRVRDGDGDGDLPLILAGGLTADNVADAVATVAPFAVDVSSGVETGGVKDAIKIKKFCAAVRDCER